MYSEKKSVTKLGSFPFLRGPNRSLFKAIQHLSNMLDEVLDKC